MKSFYVLLFSFFIFHFLGVNAQDTIYVPQDYPTIQQGIDVANPGDVILVDDDTYTENINFYGKAITVASYFLRDGDTNHINTTIIDGGQNGSVVTFITGEDSTSVLCGFTITGGTGMDDPSSGARIGGGIVCYWATAKIIHNKITGNEVSSDTDVWGGGIACIRENSNYWMIIEDNTIENNQSLNQTGSSSNNTATGAGLEVWGNARIRNNIIADNHAICSSGFSGGGGAAIAGINSHSDTVIFENNTVIYNTISSDNFWCAGGGLNVENANSFITGNVFENNACDGYVAAHGGAIKINLGKTMISSNSIRFNQIFGNDGAYGGGVSCWYSFVKLNNNDISYNTVTSYDLWGGGVHLYYPEVVNIEDNLISYNEVFTDSVWAGAGICCISPQNTSHFDKNQFIGNIGPIYSTYPQLISYGSGGGLLITGADETEIIIDANIFQGDTAKYGGGLSIKHSFNVKVTNNLLIENNAYNGGGLDIVNVDWKGKEILHPQFINNTFFQNYTEDSGYAGAMYIRCEYQLPPVIFNNIFYENQSDHGNDLYLFNNIDTVLIAFSNIDPANISGNSPFKLVENINEDPGFIDDTCHIDQFSPCEDMGTDSLEVDGLWYYVPQSDFEGTPRPWNMGIDIGADECDIIEKVPDPIVINNAGIHLRQNNPNPFSDQTTIGFYLPEEQKVSLKVYDLSGREFRTLVSGKLGKGEHTYVLHSGNLQSGFYLYRLKAGDAVMTRKLVVQK